MYSSFLSSKFSISFHISTFLSSIFSKSFHNLWNDMENMQEK
jgi:hypothetical protein